MFTNQPVHKKTYPARKTKATGLEYLHISTTQHADIASLGSINQSQPMNQSLRKPTNSTDRSINQPINQPTHQNYQPTKQSAQQANQPLPTVMYDNEYPPPSAQTHKNTPQPQAPHPYMVYTNFCPLIPPSTINQGQRQRVRGGETVGGALNIPSYINHPLNTLRDSMRQAKHDGTLLPKLIPTTRL